MPPKVKQLISELERSGFVNRGGKGSHRNFVHPNLATPVTSPDSRAMTPSTIRFGQYATPSRNRGNERQRQIRKDRRMVG